MEQQAPPAARLDDERLLDRDAELQALRRAVRAAAAGRGGWVLVTGQAGIGKTELVRSVLAELPEATCTVASARASELERSFPFGVVRQLLEPLVVGVSAPEAEALFAGAAGLARAALAPPGDERVAALAGDPDYATLHGLYWLCANVSDRRPLILFVDDVPWADEASLRWLSFLVRRLAGLPVLLVLTARSGGEAEPSPALGELLAQAPTLTIRPPALSRTAVAELVARVLGPPAEAFVVACQRATRGNPLFLGELLALLRDRDVRPGEEAAPAVTDVGPAQVAELVLRRLERLGGPAWALVRAAAVLGDGAAPAAVHRLAGLTAADAGDLAHRLERAELLALTPSVAFAHPIVRAAVVAALTPADRAWLHRRAAELLLADGDLEGAANQLLHVPPMDDPWVVGLLREGAARAKARGAGESAVALLERALAEPPAEADRGEVLLELGRVELRRRSTAARTHLAAALEATPDPGRRAVIADELARVLHTLNRSDEGLAVAEAALAELAGDAHDLRALLVIRIGELARFSPRRLEVLRRLDPEPPSGGDDPLRRRLLARCAVDAHLAGQPAGEVVALAAEALDDGRLVDDVASGSMALFFAVVALARSGRLEHAEEQLARAIASARRRGAVATYIGALSVRARLHLLRGDVVAAETDAREVGRLEQRGLGRDFVEPVLLTALVEQGRAGEAASELTDSPLGGPVPTAWIFTAGLHARGLVRLAVGRREEGLADVLEAGRRQEAVGVHNPADLPWRGTAALVLAELGREQEARDLAREEVRLARAAGVDAALGAALRVAARVCDEPPLLAEGLARLERSPARLELARALIDHGRRLRERGDHGDAREALQRARELAERCGGSALEAEAAGELVEAGGRPRRSRTRGAAALTPAERRTAELVAEGMANREVAQALFVTEKTVEAHLARVFRKLEISSRVQMADALARRDPQARAPGP